MDAARFDRLVRSLTTAASRRRTVTGLVAGLLAQFAPDAGTDADRRRKQGRRRRRDQQIHDERKKRKSKKKKKPTNPSPEPECTSNPQCQAAHGECAVCQSGRCMQSHEYCEGKLGSCAICIPSFTCVKFARLCGDRCISDEACCTDEECQASHGECAVCTEEGECFNSGNYCQETYDSCHSCEDFRCKRNGRECNGQCIPDGACCTDAECQVSHGECAVCSDTGECDNSGNYCQDTYDQCHSCENYTCKRNGRLCEGQCIAEDACCTDAECRGRYGPCAACLGGECLPDDGYCHDHFDPCHQCDAQTATCVAIARRCGETCVPLDGCCDDQECLAAHGGDCMACLNGQCQPHNPICQFRYGSCHTCKEFLDGLYMCAEGEGRDCGDTCIAANGCCSSADCEECEVCTADHQCEPKPADPGACSASNASCFTTPGRCGAGNGCYCRQAAAGSGKCGNLCVGFQYACRHSCDECLSNYECIEMGCCRVNGVGVACVQRCANP